ncbi:hypothetical protein LTR08_001349 [Meristemomyces frigidus]|nr:hypothetical protein LTR08_001349 [Meristemomyces frigidus]
MADNEDNGPPKKLRRLATEKPSFGFEMVEVRVGEDRVGEDSDDGEAKTFHVHKDLLTQHSDFFRAAFTGDWKERADGVIRLPEDEVEAFEQFYWFVYTGSLFTIREGDHGVGEDNHPTDKEFGRLAAAWALGNKLQCTPFKDALTDGLIAKGLKERSWPYGIYAAINLTAARSAGIRRFLIDLAALTWSENYFAEMEFTTTEFLHDLVLALAKARAHGVSKSKPWENAGCRYHEHGEDKQCYKKVFG